MLLSNTAAAGVVLTPWSFCLVQSLWMHGEEQAAAQPGRMGRQLVLLLHAGTHLEELQGLICTPAHHLKLLQVFLKSDDLLMPEEAS